MTTLLTEDQIRDNYGWLESIRQNRDDDEIRLIYADWLDDVCGNPLRAEFIRLQIRIAANELRDHFWIERFSIRTREMFLDNHETWAWLPVLGLLSGSPKRSARLYDLRGKQLVVDVYHQSLGPDHPEFYFERGMLIKLCCSFQHFTDYGYVILEDHPGLRNIWIYGSPASALTRAKHNFRSDWLSRYPDGVEIRPFNSY